MNPLRIVVVDDHELVRTGLQQTLNRQEGLRVVAACGNGAQALRTLQSRGCDVLLLDLALPDMSGLDVLRQLRVADPHLPVLVLSAYPETQFGVQVDGRCTSSCRYANSRCCANWLPEAA